MTIKLAEFKRRLLANPKVKSEYDRLAPEFELAASLVAARTRAGLTQAQIARRMKTSQSVVARLESGMAKPSTRTLERFAKATGSRVHIRLVAPD